ncbi:hypothetical protein BpHYR1_054286 [Brachionus plicatilis]|uniref:Uncharacterized protein n=1 Tax=Brachionus plicatilis TaxID=10195 RepID=A0A3M7S437_BRAPC|nr:hypothetical protein BpHYR1_054286 [Brachionus plicatilis]
MLVLIGTLYHALDNAINRKLLHMVDDVDTEIPFNLTKEAAWSSQFFIEKLQTIYSDKDQRKICSSTDWLKIKDKGTNNTKKIED